MLKSAPSRMPGTQLPRSRQHGRKLRKLPAKIKPGGDYGEHAQRMHCLRARIGRIGSRNTDGDLDRTIVNSIFKPFHDRSKY